MLRNRRIPYFALFWRTPGAGIIHIFGSSFYTAAAATAKSLQSCPTQCDPIDGSPPGSSMGFSRQEHWNGLPSPFPGDLSNPGIKPPSPAWQADSVPLSHLGSPTTIHTKSLDSHFTLKLVQGSVRSMVIKTENQGRKGIKCCTQGSSGSLTEMPAFSAPVLLS